MIREAQLEDAEMIVRLLSQLDYVKSKEFIEKKLGVMLADNSYKVLLCEFEGQVVSLLTIHFYHQIGYEGEFATIGFFVVDENIRSKGIGKAMEDYCTALAHQRGCALIEVYSSVKRVDAHRFYERQGYKAYERYFIKEINEKA